LAKHEIDIEAEKARYEAELNQFMAQLQQIEQQRAMLVQAIQERRGILGYLNSLDQHREAEDVKNITKD
jgi:prefoldin subunit 5